MNKLTTTDRVTLTAAIALGIAPILDWVTVTGGLQTVTMKGMDIQNGLLSRYGNGRYREAFLIIAMAAVTALLSVARYRKGGRTTSIVGSLATVATGAVAGWSCGNFYRTMTDFIANDPDGAYVNVSYGTGFWVAAAAVIVILASSVYALFTAMGDGPQIKVARPQISRRQVKRAVTVFGVCAAIGFTVVAIAATGHNNTTTDTTAAADTVSNNDETAAADTVSNNDEIAAANLTYKQAVTACDTAVTDTYPATPHYYWKTVPGGLDAETKEFPGTLHCLTASTPTEVVLETN